MVWIWTLELWPLEVCFAGGSLDAVCVFSMGLGVVLRGMQHVVRYLPFATQVKRLPECNCPESSVVIVQGV